MSHQILKSRLNLPDAHLKLLVQSHADELTQWTENMRLYEEEQAAGPTPEEPQREQFEDDETYTRAYVAHGEVLRNRRQRYPAPDAPHPEIDLAVSRDGGEFTPDYEVVDDRPPEPTELETLKAKYMRQVSEAEREALSALTPAGKVRFNQIRLAKIFQTEGSARNALLVKRNVLKDSDFGAEALDDRIKEPADKDRSPEDRQFVEEQLALQEKQNLIQEKAASMLSDIEDMTEDNVRSWTLTPF